MGNINKMWPLLVLVLSILLFFFVLMLLSKNGDINNKKIVNKQNNLTVNQNAPVDIENIKLIAADLNKGTNYYNEAESSKKALEMLAKMGDSFFTFYYKGYAYEIVGNYDEAISYYNKSLQSEEINIENKALALNQLGHIYDLKGDMKLANDYYVQSEELGLELLGNLINRGRYEFRNANYEQAEKYFNLALKSTTDSFVKAEIYFNLSTINQARKGKIDNAIKFANMGIISEKDYPNNYLSLGMSYLAKGGDSLDKSLSKLQKVIELNPNSSLAYKYLGIYYFIVDDFDNAIINFKKQEEKSSQDIMLMLNDKEKIKNEAIYDLSKVYALKGDEEKSMEYLNKVLNGENNIFFLTFMRDFSLENGSFKNITNTDTFKENFKNIISLYK